MTVSAPLIDHLLCYQKTSATAAAAMTSDLGYPPDLEPAIQDELAVLANIETRYSDELARLERSGTPALGQGAPSAAACVQTQLRVGAARLEARRPASADAGIHVVAREDEALRRPPAPLEQLCPLSA